MKKFVLTALVVLLTLIVSACDSVGVKKPVVDTIPPVITGVDDITIFLDSVFDPMEGVIAVDNIDGIITDQVVVTGTVNTSAVGTYFLRYTVEDAAGNLTEETRYVTVEVDPDMVGDALVKNGDFSLGMAFWSTTMGLEGGLGNFNVVDGELVIEVLSVSGGDWEPRLENKGITFVEGQAYRVTFDARALVPRSISVRVLELLAGPPWYIDFKPGQRDAFELTTEMETYSFDFIMGLETNENGVLAFEFGSVDEGPYLTTVYLDNVSIVEIDGFVDIVPPVISGVNDATIVVGQAFDPLAGVTAIDNVDGDITNLIAVSGTVNVDIEGIYVLTYTVSDAANNETIETRTINVVGMIFNPTDIIKNGDFVDPIDELDPEWVLYQANWDPATSPMSSGSMTIVDGELVLQVIDVGAWGPMSWVLQAMQTVELEQGYTYKVIFSAKADVARQIVSATGYTDVANGYSWVGFGTQTFDLTTEFETFEYMFTIDKDSGIYPIEFKFEFGQALETVYIESVEIQVWEQGQIQENGTFDETGWFVWHQFWGDAPVVTDGIVDGQYVITSSNSLGDANWAIQFVQEGLAVEEGTTYRVTFDAVADQIRDINFKFIDNNNVEFLYVAELTTVMGTFTFDFLYTGTATGGKISIELGVIGDAVPGETIFDNISMVELDSENAPTGANLVVNGTFDQIVAWQTWNQFWDEGIGFPTVDVEGVTGELVLTYDGLGNYNWSIQLFQENVPMAEGGTYVMQFDMKADHARAINFKMIGVDYEYAEEINLTTEMVTYTITFVYSGPSGLAKINFEFGVLPDALAQGVITVDNVLLYRNFN